MVKKKVVSLGLILTLGVTMLSGCGASSDIAQLNSIKALNSEASTDDVNLSLSEKQSMVYAQVSERQLLDLSVLDACSESEIQQVTSYMDSVDAQLTGSVSKDNGVIDSCFTDYLLSEFEKTPYYWQRSRTTIRGIDSKSRSIVVDVDFNTIGFKKDVTNDSYLVLGETNYSQKAKVRYDRWISILQQKYNGSGGNWQSDYNKFKSVYGDPSKIFESQRNLSLTEQIYESGNQKTYSGEVDSDIEIKGGEMTVRFVLVPKYVLGVNLGIDCKHMYVTNYSLTEDPTEKMELFKDDGYSTISDNVYKLVDSYFKCIDEEDQDGLYKLTHDYKKMDKYYQDMFDTSYRKHNGFTVSLFNIEGTNITCGVQVSSQIRAKGSNMTMPSYTDRYLLELQLVDDTLQVTNMVLLSRKLEGEPAILTEDAEEAGFVASIDLSNTSKISIEKLICDLSALQLQGDEKSDKFMAIVDYSITDNKLARIKEKLKANSGAKKVVWLQNYQQGTSNYASVKCRELYQAKDNSIVETSATYEFILKGEKWYVYDYNVLSSVKLDTTNLQTSNSLCLVTPGKVESYTSQVTSTASDDKEDTKKGVPDGVVFEHKVVEPVLKHGSKEQGLVTLSVDTLSTSQFSSLWDEVKGGSGLEVKDLKSIDASLGLESSSDASVVKNAKKLVCIYYNGSKNRISKDQYQEELDAYSEALAQYGEVWNKKDGNIEGQLSDIANNLN